MGTSAGEEKRGRGVVGPGVQRIRELSRMTKQIEGGTASTQYGGCVKAEKASRWSCRRCGPQG